MSIFNKIFGKFVSTVKSFTSFKFMSGWTPTFTSVGDDIYKTAVTRSCIHAIANNAAKLHPVHVFEKEGKPTPTQNSTFQRLLSERPNPLMSAFDYIYQMITIRENKNNAFALIERDSFGKATMFIPIHYSSVTAVESSGLIFMKFILNNGTTMVLPYDDLIHLRKFYYDKDIFGENNDALYPTLELINTVNEGISNAVVSSASLRGILMSKGVMSPDDMRDQRDKFVTDYLGAGNNGGIAVTDSKMEFKQLESKPMLINQEQMTAIKNEVYDYFSINEKIVQSKYNEDEWNAFYESVLEPIATQLSQEYTNKVFTEREKGYGNKIVFTANKLAYASNKTKISMVKEVGILGAMTLNEIREIFNMAPVKDGDKRVQTLNVVNAANADKYQNGGEGND